MVPGFDLFLLAISRLSGQNRFTSNFIFLFSAAYRHKRPSIITGSSTRIIFFPFCQGRHQ
jgi:hypothetical protein